MFTLAYPQASRFAANVAVWSAQRGIATLPLAQIEQAVIDLVEGRAALLLADAAKDGVDWIVAAQRSPSTRRLPCYLVDGQDTTAQQIGARRTISSIELIDQLDALWAAAIAPLQATHNALGRECLAPLPEAAIEGLRLFNAGEYYRQHDVFEALWVAEPAAVRDLYRAILQVGVAYYQVQRGNAAGALKMLLRAAVWLALLPDRCRGVDIADLRANAAAVRMLLERGQTVPPEMLKPVLYRG
jgi:uncharacterized protein